MNKEENNEMSASTQDQKDFENLASAMSSAGIGETREMAVADIGELCKKYHQIEPALKKALPFIKLIPKYGGIIAKALEFLMGIADSACPIDLNN